MCLFCNERRGIEIIAQVRQESPKRCHFAMKRLVHGQLVELKQVGQQYRVLGSLGRIVSHGLFQQAQRLHRLAHIELDQGQLIVRLVREQARRVIQ